MNKMTPKERFFSMLASKPIDRLPSQLDFSPKCLLKLYDHFGIPQRGEENLLPYFDNHIVYALAKNPFGRLRRHDFSQNVYYDDWGIGWDMTQEGLFINHYPLRDILKYERLSMDYLKNHDIMDYTKGIMYKFSNDYVICSNQVSCLFERYYMLRGFENALMDFFDEPDYLFEILDRITEYQVELAKLFVGEKVHCGRLGDDYGSQKSMLFSPECWQKLIKPRLTRIVEIYKENGIPVILHSCGDITPIIADIIEIGIDILNPVQPETMDLFDLSEQYGDKLVFYGGLSLQKAMISESTDVLENDIRNCVDALGQNKKLIISPGQYLTSDMSVERILLLKDLMSEYSNNYPNGIT